MSQGKHLHIPGELVVTLAPLGGERSMLSLTASEALAQALWDYARGIELGVQHFITVTTSAARAGDKLLALRRDIPSQRLKVFDREATLAGLMGQTLVCVEMCRRGSFDLTLNDDSYIVRHLRKAIKLNYFAGTIMPARFYPRTCTMDVLRPSEAAICKWTAVSERNSRQLALGLQPARSLADIEQVRDAKAELQKLAARLYDLGVDAKEVSRIITQTYAEGGRNAR